MAMLVITRGYRQSLGLHRIHLWLLEWPVTDHPRATVRSYFGHLVNDATCPPAAMYIGLSRNIVYKQKNESSKKDGFGSWNSFGPHQYTPELWLVVSNISNLWQQNGDRTLPGRDFQTDSVWSNDSVNTIIYYNGQWMWSQTPDNIYQMDVQLRIFWEPSRLAPHISVSLTRKFCDYHLVMTNIAMENHHF